MTRPAERAGAAAVVAAGTFLLGLLCAEQGAEYRPSLNRERSDAGIAAATDPPPRLARRLLIVILDGLRADTAETMQFLQELASGGGAGVALSSYPTVSRPNYVAILTGCTPRQSGVRTNDWHDPVTIDDLGRRASSAGIPASTIADKTHALEEIFPSFAARVTASEGQAVTMTLRELSTKETSGGLVVTLFLATDDAGHRSGAASREYREAAQHLDASLRRLVGALDLTKDAIIATADHGHVDTGGHGGLEPEVVHVPLVLAGAGIRRGSKLPVARNVDVAPTAAVLLGIAPPAQCEGRALIEALELTPRSLDDVGLGDAPRRASLLLANDRFQKSLSSEAHRTAIERSALAMSLALGLVLGARVARRRSLALIDGRVGARAALHFAAVAGILWAFIGHVPSSSFLPTRERFGATLGKLVLGAGLLAAMALLASKPGKGPPPLSAFTGHTMLLALLAACIGGAAWSYGALCPASLPGPITIVLPGLVLAASAAALITASPALLIALALTLLGARRGPAAAPLPR